MKFTQTLAASAVLLATSSIAFAIDDSTSILIQITEDAAVTLTGTLSANSPAIGLTKTNLNNATALSLGGDLGLTSNVDGICGVTVTSANAAVPAAAFKLENQSLAGTYLHGTTPYSIGVLGNIYGGTANTTAGTTNCTTVNAPVTITTGAVLATIPAGTTVILFL